MGIGERQAYLVIAQLAIMFLGVLSAWIYNAHDDRVRRYGPIVSGCAQPFWLYVTFVSAQWGMFALSWFYTAMAVRGIFNYWVKR